ncbi:hypothetical protein HY029_06180 [Candidatus Gottesmanbacteria bacterium]|nr:hypothetical protein [Candidatus Gottesmanbacteria bacterium]
MILKILKSKIVFFVLATLFILALNLTPMIMQVRHTPPGRTLTLIHNNTQDYYFYLSLMNEGANGAWMTYDPYTSEGHQPSIIFSYFLWLGRLSKILGLWYPYTYHLTRIILGLILLITSYYLILYLKIPYPNLTYFFFLFASPFMHTINDYGTLRSVPYMHWWNGIDPVRRAAFLPHHMLGGFLLVTSIIVIFKYINKPQRKYLFWLILLSAIMAFVHTPSLLIILLIIPSSMLIYYFLNISNGQNSKVKIQKSKLIGLLGYWVIGLIFLLFMVSQTKNGFPWSQYIDWEKNLQFPLDRELIGALGILLPFSIMEIYQTIKSKKFENIFILCWLVIPLLFIPIAPKLNLSNVRLIQGVPYLPLAILAILGIKTIEKFLKQFSIFNFKFSLNFQKLNIKNLDFISNFKFQISNLVALTSITLFIIFTYPTLYWSIKDQIREYWPFYGNVYLDNRIFDAFNFINLNYPTKSVTLSTFYTGNYLPAYTNTISFIGHFGYTYKEQEKENDTQRLFEDKMTTEEAKNFLVSNKIALVFQGPEEKPFAKNYLYPTLLKPVYDKEAVTIYKLNL